MQKGENNRIKDNFKGIFSFLWVSAAGYCTGIENSLQISIYKALLGPFGVSLLSPMVEIVAAPSGSTSFSRTCRNCYSNVWPRLSPPCLGVAHTSVHYSH